MGKRRIYRFMTSTSRSSRKALLHCSAPEPDGTFNVQRSTFNLRRIGWLNVGCWMLSGERWFMIGSFLPRCLAWFGVQPSGGSGAAPLEGGPPCESFRTGSNRFLAWVLLAGLWAGFTLSSRAAIQFDLFLGYDNVVREAGWFPVGCEILNDGPTFNGVVEIYSGNMRSDQVRRVALELPTNTRKRFVIPMFASGARFFQWNARLLDDRGRVQSERQNLQPATLSWEGILLGALPRSFAGLPVLPDIRQNRPDLKPRVARLQVEQFPDNPIALEGLDALYLNSERALALNVNQVAALLAWLQGGGQLIVGVEQLVDVTSTPWLQQLLPCDLNDMTTVTIDDDAQQWLRREDQPSARFRTAAMQMRRRQGFYGGGGGYMNLAVDPSFVQAQLPVATGTLRGGNVLLSAQGKPLIIEARRGRGQLTLLTFSPEREPFRSWKNRAWFWSKVAGVPSDWYSAPEFMSSYGGSCIDAVFGALIDSRQVRKLPVKWLLLLLVVYLIVIGPFDQYWLKKIGRQMLTWITFPTYVVLFSLLIYFIGYKLRAGETEWNELHVVDVLPRSETQAEMRGRTFASIYSSANARYQLGFTAPSPELVDQTHATLRGELLDLFGGAKEGSRANVDQDGNGFRAEVFVPVWTSLLYVNDWLQPGAMPFKASVTSQGSTWNVTVENLLDRPLNDVRLVVKGSTGSVGSVFEIGNLAAREKKSLALESSRGVLLSNFVQQHGGGFEGAVEQRRNPLGDNQRGWLSNSSLNSMVASFPAYLPFQRNQRGFVAPAGFDLTPLVERGDAVFLAWVPNYSFSNPIYRFKPPRSQRNTLLRLAVPTDAVPKN